MQFCPNSFLKVMPWPSARLITPLAEKLMTNPLASEGHSIKLSISVASLFRAQMHFSSE
jgi:hypothetical protein